jgi:DNA gyrase subunit A
MQTEARTCHAGDQVRAQQNPQVRIVKHHIEAVIDTRTYEDGAYLFFATRNGLVKKTELKDFSHVRSNGIYAISIEQGDELVAANLTDGQQIVFLATHEGQAIRFDEEDVRPMGRQAYGVWGIRMEKGDYLVGMATTPKADVPAKVDPTKAPATDAQIADLVPEKGRLILSVTENGYGKRTAADEYRLINRGGKGVINVKTTERVGKVEVVAFVQRSDPRPEPARAERCLRYPARPPA